MPFRILMLEDDPAVAGVFTEFLVGEGHSVVAVHDAPSAMRLATEQTWDVCLADSSPRSNGQLHADDRAIFSALSRAAPVILTTGRAWTRDVDPSDIGVADILTKPIDFDVLLKSLDAAARVKSGRD